MIDSRDQVHVEKLQALQLETLDLIDELLPTVEYSPYVHETFFHSSKIIGKIKSSNSYEKFQ